ncbi:MalM family protein [Vibrio spartinae]|uniref:Maltose regulon periplasmic protein n=1 Tax=Vibrio spartinae TaxID=1918945 RepID=A0A1N6M9K8_9VIBR|nr:MalM family protein [Vibrio spartinae]SIO96129.1 maltose regulon periplasmic protein [Vibrio spartinae]
MQKMQQLIHFTLALFMVSGCSATKQVQNIVSPPAADSVCCTRYQEVYWTPLNASDNIKLKIDSSSPVRNFSSGRSYFGAFQFSPRSGTVNLTLKSLVFNDQIFMPTLVFLDANYHPQKTFQIDPHQLRFSDVFEPDRLEQSYQINAEQTPYLIIFTQPNQVGQTITIPHPAKRRAIEDGAPLPIVADIPVTTGYQGSLTMTVETESIRQHALQQSPPTSGNRAMVNTPTSPKSNIKNNRWQHTAPPQAESTHYYRSAIEHAVSEHDIAKALALLDEAKALRIPDIQQTFIHAINMMQSEKCRK